MNIYVYCYLNHIHSSRRLECKADRNIELIWLTGRLVPDFKTIADFRRNNGKAISRASNQFVFLCRQIVLLDAAQNCELVAIDGSKFKADKNLDKNFISTKLQRRMDDIQANIKRYMDKLDAADRNEPTLRSTKVDQLQERIATLRDQMAELKTIGVEMEQSSGKQVSTTEPDAHSMRHRGTGIVDYKVQAAIDSKHHLIIAHGVITSG